jgi:hypothetical protein
MADPVRLTRRERILVHQIHPAKLATDISVAVVSTVLFWQHRLVPGLLVFALPAPIASALVLRRNLSAYRDSAAGRYVLAHMPPSMQAVRSVSAIAIAVGGWRRSPALILAGLTLVGLGWSHGLLPSSRRAKRFSGITAPTTEVLQATTAGARQEPSALGNASRRYRSKRQRPRWSPSV